MAKTYQSDGERAIKRAEKVLQRHGWSGSITASTLSALLAELDVSLFYVELNGDEQGGPWLTKRGAEDYIDTHICERGVCDDAYDRVMQEYAITDADGNEVS